jgi:flagellar biosynthesis protein
MSKEKRSRKKGEKRYRLKQVVALAYDPVKNQAPMVSAKGQGHLAEEIIELAKKHDVPIREDPDLLNILFQLDLDEEIPPAVYELVAEIFAFLYRLNRHFPLGPSGASSQVQP